MFKKRLTSITMAVLTVFVAVPAYADTQSDIANAKAEKSAREASLSCQ